MKQPKDYRVVHGDTVQKLRSEVTYYIELGWELQGGVAVHAIPGFPDRALFFQAMVDYYES